MFNIIKLRAENKRLKEELAQKEITIQYLNALVSRANRRYLEQVKQVEAMKSIDHLDFPNSNNQERENLIDLLSTGPLGKYIDFPNSSVESEGQISIHDILEN